MGDHLRVLGRSGLPSPPLQHQQQSPFSGRSPAGRRRKTGIREDKQSVTQVQNVFKELLLLLRLKGTQRSQNPDESKIQIVKKEAVTPCDGCTRTIF